MAMIRIRWRLTGRVEFVDDAKAAQAINNGEAVAVREPECAIVSPRECAMWPRQAGRQV